MVFWYTVAFGQINYPPPDGMNEASLREVLAMKFYSPVPIKTTPLPWSSATTRDWATRPLNILS